MNRHLLPLCAFACAAASPAAVFAQGSSVSIYGAIDAGLQIVSDVRGQRERSMASGGMQPERIGFRGSEDMGGGLKADFRLETGILSKQGRPVSPSAFFNRESSLGLSGGFGTVRLGRMPDLMYEFIPKYLSPPALTAIVNKHPGNWDNFASQYQFSNTVMVATPTLGGFNAALQYGFGEAPGDAQRGRNMSLGATYTAGGWRTALVASEHRDRPVDIAGRLGLRQAFGLALTPGTPVVTDAVRNLAIGTSWRQAGTLVGAAWSRTRMVARGQTAVQDNLDLGAAWSLPANNTLQATLTLSEFESARWTQLTLSGIHAFSKRTSVYVQGRYQRAGGSAPAAAIADIGISSSRKQWVLTTGLFHAF